uniref:Apolipoprotein D n=1 Tax=Taeniopygia guttata TaxID=59729 RepID=H0ZFA1_TAEGU
AAKLQPISSFVPAADLRQLTGLPKNLYTLRTREWLVPELKNDDPSTLIKRSRELTTGLFLAALVLCGASLHLVTKYLGKWYEIEKLPSTFEKGSCIQANYSLKENGKFKVVNKEMLANGKINEAEGELMHMDVKQPAKLGVRFNWFMPAAPYWVISTDYENYSLVYSCTNILWLFHMDYAWILSRAPDMHPETVEHLKSVLESYKISTEKMMPTDQANCPAEM